MPANYSILCFTKGKPRSLSFDKKNELVQFKKIDLTHSDHEIPKWRSVINENSNKQISASFDYSLFLKSIKEHTPKQKLKNKFNY